MKLFLLPLLACGLWAQDATFSKLPPKDSGTTVVAVSPEAESLKARIAWLEQKLALTEQKLAALGQFYSANEQLQGLAAKEPKVEPKQ